MSPPAVTRRRLRFAAVLLGLAMGPTALAEEEDPSPKEVYQVRLAVDGPIIAVGAATGLLRGTLASRFVNHTCPCDPSGINGFDRGAVGNHSATANTLAGVTVVLALGVPPLLDLLDVGASRAFVEDITVMSETVMVAIPGKPMRTSSAVGQPTSAGEELRAKRDMKFVVEH